jgi:type IV pilus assembly protein PilB
MTHTELIKAIAKQLSLRPEEVSILWQQTSKIMTKELARHEKIRIKNFGAFVAVKHKSRTVPDPRQLSKKLVIFDQYLPKFRPSEQLRAQVKGVEGPTIVEESETSEETPDETPVEAPEEELKAKVDTAPIKLDEADLKPKTPKKGATKGSKPVAIGYADLGNLTVDQEILNLIPFNMAQKYQAVPIEKDKTTLTVAMIDPGDRDAIEQITRQTDLKVQPKITTQSELQHVLDQYSGSNEITPDLEGMEEAANLSEEDLNAAPEENDSPAAKIVSNLLERAVREKASDIHIEPEEKMITIRFRIDGILQKVHELPKNIQASLISRLKILSSLKIDETRLPQDGRLRQVIDRKEVDFRLSTLPTVQGEKIVMRILDKSDGILGFEELGISGVNLDRVNDNITKSHGMILVTGPTGSGKTTTLYAVLGKLMGPGVNIVTMEDPVEYRIAGINQSQVNASIGYDFASGLRTIVRQDPDIILIGEIRDLDTATMAIHSALTGHIVLSTLHTNDAAGAIPRLIDMGIEPFLITSSTNAIVAQRLVRKICQKCKMSIKLPDEALTEVRSEIEKMPEAVRPTDSKLIFSKGKGCSQCNNSGYTGRFGIYETLSVTEEIKQLALKRVSASELTAKAIEQGMVTLKQDGILKALAGETTLEEVWRVTKD